jgi:hypothetical protein
LTRRRTRGCRIHFTVCGLRRGRLNTRSPGLGCSAHNASMDPIRIRFREGAGPIGRSGAGMIGPFSRNERVPRGPLVLWRSLVAMFVGIRVLRIQPWLSHMPCLFPQTPF